MAGFDDPFTMALLAAGGAMMDPDGGMGAGMQAGVNAFAVGSRNQQQKLANQTAQDKLMRKLNADQMLQQVIKEQGEQGPINPVNLAQGLIKTQHPDLVSHGLSMLKDFRPKAKGVRPVVVDGQQFDRPYFDDGSFGEASALPSPVRPMQVNQGSQISFVDPNSLQSRGTMGVGMAPGEAARLAQSDRQFNQSHGLAQQNHALAQQKFALDSNLPFQAQMQGAIAGAKEQSKRKVDAVSNLPKVIDQANESIQLIDDLVAHPGFGMMVGKTNPIGEVAALMPGTDARDFKARFEQIKGKQFLEAFETLKGGGQITEVEGIKATQAISRMERAQSEPEFERAAREFQGIIQRGVDRASGKAGVSSDGMVRQPQLTPREQQQRSTMGGGGFSARRLD